MTQENGFRDIRKCVFSFCRIIVTRPVLTLRAELFRMLLSLCKEKKSEPAGLLISWKSFNNLDK